MSNLIIGYHIEGGEPFTNNGSICLSMKTLNDNRPLFLCDNMEEWWPRHLNTDGFTIYKVTYVKPEKCFTTKDCDLFGQLISSYNEILNKYVYSDLLLSMISKGIHLFELEQDNNKEELSEIMLISPTKYVTNIEVINYNEDKPIWMN